MTDSQNADLDTILRAKPSFEEAQAQYRNQIQILATQIAALVPGLTWHVKEDSWGGCTGKYAHTRGINVYIYVLFDGPIPDANWPQALDIVEAGAADLGATEKTTILDRPGDHDVVFGGPEGLEIEFGTKAATILAAKSDCRLREADMAASRSKTHP